MKRILLPILILLCFSNVVHSKGAKPMPTPIFPELSRMLSSDFRSFFSQVNLPFQENFDGSTHSFILSNGTQKNYWVVGTAVSASPQKSLYITNNGTANAYATNQLSTSHAYVSFAVDPLATEINVSFKFKCKGETIHDYVRVWVVPDTFTPTPGTQISVANSQGVLLTVPGASTNPNTIGKLNSNTLGSAFGTAFGDVNLVGDALPFVGTNVKLVFEWKNDATSGLNPPAAIDDINIDVTIPTCTAPTNISVSKENDQSLITWTPTGNETSWELVIQPIGTGNPDAATVIPVNGTPSYLFTPQDGVIYEIYVRAVCSDTDKSAWQGPETFSDFTPPGCAKLDIEEPNLRKNDKGEYIICDGETKNIDLKAIFDEESFKYTNTYAVESIDYAPPYPFTGGTPLNISVDDIWSPPVQLPFNVCFFGKSFSTAQVGSNGMVTFGKSYTASAPYDFGNATALPSPNFPSVSKKLVDCILGVYQDINPAVTNQGSTPDINYAVLGTYPCRALVVNFHDVKLFSSSCYSYPGQTYQIVIYEITNIIEVYVKKRNSCASWQDGKGVIALINSDGTEAITPPGRNIGAWNAADEAWRFKPNGNTAVTFGWYANGQLIGTNPEMNYAVSEATVLEAVVSFSACEGENLELKKTINILKADQLDLPEMEDTLVCVKDKHKIEIDLKYNEDKIKKALGENRDLDITYHLKKEEAEAGANKLPHPEKQEFMAEELSKTIYVRVKDKLTDCYRVGEFQVIRGEFPTMQHPEDLVICTGYVLPNLPDEKYYYGDIVVYDDLSGTVKDTLKGKKPGDALSYGKYKIPIHLVSKDKCEDKIDYEVLVKSCSIPKGISPNGDGLNDFLDLSEYFPLSVKIYNRYGQEVYSKGIGYKNDWVGQSNQGEALPDGTYFIDVVTLNERITQWIQLNR